MENTKEYLIHSNKDPLIFGAVAIVNGPISVSISEVSGMEEQPVIGSNSPAIKLTGKRSSMITMTFVFDSDMLDESYIDYKGYDVRADAKAFFAQLNITPFIPVYSKKFVDIVGQKFESDVEYVAVQSVRLSINSEIARSIRVDVSMVPTNLPFLCGGFVTFPDILIEKDNKKELESTVSRLYQSRFFQALLEEEADKISTDNLTGFTMRVDSESALDLAKDYAYTVLNSLDLEYKDMEELRQTFQYTFDNNVTTNNITFSPTMVTNIETGYDNLVTPQTIEGNSVPFHQYGGRVMKTANVQLVLQDTQEIDMMRKFQYMIQEIAENVGIIRGQIPIEINSLPINLIGFKRCVIQRIDIASIPNTPGSFYANIHLYDNSAIFNREQLIPFLTGYDEEIFTVMAQDNELEPVINEQVISGKIDNYYENVAGNKYNYHPLILNSYSDIVRAYKVNWNVMNFLLRELKQKTSTVNDVNFFGNFKFLNSKVLANALVIENASFEPGKKEYDLSVIKERYPHLFQNYKHENEIDNPSMEITPEANQTTAPVITGMPDVDGFTSHLNDMLEYVDSLEFQQVYSKAFHSTEYVLEYFADTIPSPGLDSVQLITAIEAFQNNNLMYAFGNVSETYNSVCNYLETKDTLKTDFDLAEGDEKLWIRAYNYIQDTCDALANIADILIEAQSYEESEINKAKQAIEELENKYFSEVDIDTVSNFYSLFSVEINDPTTGIIYLGGLSEGLVVEVFPKYIERFKRFKQNNLEFRNHPEGSSAAKLSQYAGDILSQRPTDETDIVINDTAFTPINKFQIAALFSLGVNPQDFYISSSLLGLFRSGITNVLYTAAVQKNPEVAGLKIAHVFEEAMKNSDDFMNVVYEGIYSDLDQLFLPGQADYMVKILDTYYEASESLNDVKDFMTKNKKIDDSSNAFTKMLLTEDFEKMAETFFTKGMIPEIEEFSNIGKRQGNLEKLIEEYLAKDQKAINPDEIAKNTFIPEKLKQMKTFGPSEESNRIIQNEDDIETFEDLDKIAEEQPAKLNELYLKHAYTSDMLQLIKYLQDDIFGTTEEIKNEDDTMNFQANTYDAMNMSLSDTITNLIDKIPRPSFMLPNAVVIFMVQKSGLTVPVSDLYSYYSITSAEVRKEEDSPMHVATVQLSNNSGIINNVPADVDATVMENKENIEHMNIPDDVERVSYYTLSDNKVMSLFIQPGTVIQIRMGYGNKPISYQEVFQGPITEIENGDLVSIIASGFGIDLLKPIYKSDYTMDFWQTNPREMVCRALLETKSAAFGLGTNFFSQLVMNTQHLEEGIPELGLISDRILFPAMRATLATINVYFPDKYWGAYHQTYESKLSNNDYEEATLKKEAGKIIDQYFVRYFVKAGSSAWDVIYDAKMRIPGFIAQVENIGNGLATLFFGKPEWPYRYVPLYAIYNDLSLYNTAKDALKAAFSQETVSKIYDLYEDFKTYLNEQEELYQIKAIHPESIGANPLNVNNINHIYDTIFEFDGQRAAVFVEGYEPLDYNGDDVEKISIDGLGEVNYIPYQEDESKEAVYLDLTGWKIYDGDTLIPDMPELKNQYKSIRFLGIDAPEVNSSSEDEKKKGETARNFLKLLLEAGGCYVKYYKNDKGKNATDYYDRDLGNIFIDINGKKYNVSVLMTANGMADYYNSSYIGTKQEDAIKQGVFFANLNNLGKFSGDSSIGSQIQQIITNAQMSDANIYYKEVNPTTWKLYLYHEPDYTIDVSKIMDEDNYFMIERSSFEEVQDRKQIGSDKLIDKLNRVNTRIETAYTNVHTTYDLIRKQISDFQQLNANFQFNPYTQAKDDTIEELTAKELVLTEVIARYDNAYYLLKDHIENIYVAITESKGDMYYQHAVMWQNDMLAYPTSEEAKPFYEFFEISNDFQKEMKLIVGSASQSLSVLFKLNQLSLAIERKEKNDLSQAGLLQKHPAQIPGYRTFRREWVISDKFNLLANTVVATKTNMWNEVTFFSKDISYPIWRVFASIWNFSRNMLTPDKGEGVTIDGDKYRVYSVLFDEDIEQSDRMERQIVDENQADTQVRAILGSTYLQKGIEQMYGGVLQITGNPEIKPNDIIHLYDSHIGLSGMLKVKNVTHSLTPNGGFTTYIEPVAVTEVRDVLTLYGAQLKHHALTSVLGITLFAAGVGLGAVLTGGIGLFATIGGLLTASNANLLMSAFMGNWNYSATNEYYLDGNKAGVVITNKEAFNTIAVSPLSLNGVPYTAGLRGTEFDAYGRWDLKLERSAEYWNNFVTGLTDWGDMKDIWKNSTQWVANSYYKMELINQHFTTETGTYTNNMKNVNFGG